MLEEIYRSPQYKQPNIVPVIKIPTRKTSVRLPALTLISPCVNFTATNTITPATKNLIPAKRKGGAPASIPIFIAKNVVPKIKHIKPYTKYISSPSFLLYNIPVYWSYKTIN
ncbi:hypothetical protein DOT_2037 [Desulfosporosinus sp. OT]|nr:hypothetical protein DOT_2037 [Desulfosporosinus sp. OT]